MFNKSVWYFNKRFTLKSVMYFSISGILLLFEYNIFVVAVGITTHFGLNSFISKKVDHVLQNTFCIVLTKWNSPTNISGPPIAVLPTFYGRFRRTCSEMDISYHYRFADASGRCENSHVRPTDEQTNKLHGVIEDEWIMKNFNERSRWSKKILW